MPAALSGGPGVLLQQLQGSGDLQLVVWSRVIHPHLESQAVDRVRPGGHAEGFVGQAQLTEGLPSLPVEGGSGGLPGQKQVRLVKVLQGHPHEIPPDLQGGLIVLPVAVAGRAAASAAPGPVAAFVGHPVAGTASPGPTGGSGGFAPARGEQSPAGSGAERTDQIQVPATAGSTVQLGLLRGPTAPGDPLSAVHGRGRLRPQASTTPPPPEQGERPPYLGQLDGLLAHLHLGPDIPDPKGEHLLRHWPRPPHSRFR